MTQGVQSGCCHDPPVPGLRGIYRQDDAMSHLSYDAGVYRPDAGLSHLPLAAVYRLNATLFYLSHNAEMNRLDAIMFHLFHEAEVGLARCYHVPPVP